MDEVIGLFPTPFMLVDKLLSDELIASCREEAVEAKKAANAQTGLLSHTEPINPKSKPSYREIAKLIVPKLVDFGALMFGERLEWTIKEMWVNVLENGGHQLIHTHANSFISGVIYVTPSHPSARTVFHKTIGGSNFIFRHASKTSQMGPFNADKWAMPEVEPGAMILFPSYLLHEAPVNKGGQRITIAFNAIPKSLESWGYRINFS
jgi:uncharacterized protein (TIGR02466 family)